MQKSLNQSKYLGFCKAESDHLCNACELKMVIVVLIVSLHTACLQKMAIILWLYSWTFSILLQSSINDGPHIELQYSSVGRTIVTNNLTSILESRWSKDLLINPSSRLALLEMLLVCEWNLSWLSKRMPRSFWDSAISIAMPFI